MNAFSCIHFAVHWSFFTLLFHSSINNLYITKSFQPFSHRRLVVDVSIFTSIHPGHGFLLFLHFEITTCFHRSNHFFPPFLQLSFLSSCLPSFLLIFFSPSFLLPFFLHFYLSFLLSFFPSFPPSFLLSICSPSLNPSLPFSFPSSLFPFSFFPSLFPPYFFLSSSTVN